MSKTRSRERKSLPLAHAVDEGPFEKFRREEMAKIAEAFAPAPRPIGHFVRHSYDANGELISDATEL
jgi:hypothetical protein